MSDQKYSKKIECQPGSQYSVDIPCLNSSLIHTEIPFCGEYVTYNIDKRLNFRMLDSLAEQQLVVFNESGLLINENCYKYRKALTCSLAFPRCSTTAYAAFPCRDICYGYYNHCGASKLNGTCIAFPTMDCQSLEIIPNSTASSLFGNFIMISLLFIFI